MTRTAFVFPGQGSQRMGMARHLAAARPDLTDAYLRAADDHLGFPLSQLCVSGSARDLADPVVGEPAVFLTSLVTLELLRGRGVEPDAVAGHSLGEYTALVAAGVLEWTDALSLVRLRAELVATIGDQVPGATVALLGLGGAEVEALCARSAAATGATVGIGGDNGPDQLVVTGEIRAVTHLMAAAHRAGATRVIPLNSGGPFHSSLLRGIEAEFTEALVATDFRDPRVRLVSGVTGDELSTADEALVALRAQLTSPVRWTEAVRRLTGLGHERFVETGPGLVLGGLIRRIAPEVRVHATGTAHRLDLTTAALTPAAV